MKPSNEFCINFLKASGWLDNHDKQIRADAIEELVEFANTMPTVEKEDGEIRPMWLEEMAQKLKEQK